MAVKLQSEFSDKEVYVHGGYPASAVFYSGKRIKLLIDDCEEQSFKPKAFSWSSKNIMPYEKFSDVRGQSGYVILVKKRFNRSFMEKTDLLCSEEDAGSWYIAAYS